MSPPAELVDELPFLALILVAIVLLPCTVLLRQVFVGRIGVAAARESMFVEIALRYSLFSSRLSYSLSIATWLYPPPVEFSLEVVHALVAPGFLALFALLVVAPC